MCVSIVHNHSLMQFCDLVHNKTLNFHYTVKDRTCFTILLKHSVFVTQFRKLWKEGNAVCGFKLNRVVEKKHIMIIYFSYFYIYTCMDSWYYNFCDMQTTVICNFKITHIIFLNVEFLYLTNIESIFVFLHSNISWMLIWVWMHQFNLCG